MVCLLIRMQEELLTRCIHLRQINALKYPFFHTNEFHSPFLWPVWQCEGCQAQSEGNGGGVSLTQMDHCAPAPRVEQEIICRDSESLNEDTDVVELSRSQTDAL